VIVYSAILMQCFTNVFEYFFLTSVQMWVNIRHSHSTMFSLRPDAESCSFYWTSSASWWMVGSQVMITSQELNIDSVFLFLIL
jgi:hypothetical protein